MKSIASKSRWNEREYERCPCNDLFNKETLAKMAEEGDEEKLARYVYCYINFYELAELGHLMGQFWKDAASGSYPDWAYERLGYDVRKNHYLINEWREYPDTFISYILTYARIEYEDYLEGLDMKAEDLCLWERFATKK